MKREIISRLVDFFLGKDSPSYEFNKKRTEMGNNHVIPKLSGLICAVSLLVRRCYTPGWPEGSTLPPPTTLKEGKIYSMSKNDLIQLSHRKFYQRSLKDAYNNKFFGPLMAHLMYNDYKFSFKKTFIILENFNAYLNTLEIKNIFEIIMKVCRIQDEYSINRFEWIFGVPQLQFKMVNGSTPTIAMSTNKFNDKLFHFISPLAYGTTFDSLTEKFLYKYSLTGDFLEVFSSLICIVCSNPVLLNYFVQLPSPLRGYPTMKDYAFSLANDDLGRLVDLPTQTAKQEKDVKGTNNAFTMFESNLKLLEDEKKNKPHCLNLKYKLGQIIKETIHYINDDVLKANSISLFVIEYDTEIFTEESKEKIETATNSVINISTSDANGDKKQDNFEESVITGK